MSSRLEIANSIINFLLLLIIIAGFIIASIALHKTNSSTNNETLIQPRLERLSTIGNVPTVTLTSPGIAAFSTASFSSGSNDTSGTIVGVLLADPAPAQTNFVVKFSKKFDKVPNSVSITPANIKSSTQVFSVTGVTTEGFTFELYKSNTYDSVAVPQFYYLVM